jgi:dihydrofolate synthase/folylpolyglutamate synthase
MTDPWQASLDDIFRGYLAVKADLVGKRDVEVRSPLALIGLAERLGLIPARERTCRVTGSKGKGSVARLLADRIGQRRPGERVGLVTSPEEIEHTDRMRIDGVPIDKDRFIQLYDRLKPDLAVVERFLPPGRYLSPSGLFLLVALAWFRDEGVEHVVIEGGRGMLADEVGHIPSKVGVVTSILPEHAGPLGPDLDTIAADKLSIARLSDRVVLGPLCRPWAGDLPVIPEPERGAGFGPHWLMTGAALAATAAALYFDEAEPAPWGHLPNVPSFGRIRYRGVSCYYEGLIARASFDAGFWWSVAARYRRPAVLISLPDDKDVAGVDNAFAQICPAVRHLVLSGERGYLDYETTRQQYGERIIGSAHYRDQGGFLCLMDTLIEEQGCDALILAGTQTFLRLVKTALLP